MAITLRDRVSVVDTDYGVVLLDVRTGVYWELNSSGAVALKALLACADIGAATAEVTAQFDVDQQTATGDVRALLAELRSAGLVTG
ncbi:MAG: lasso peptide biosynthesis PqqD family chaperone [Kibdelosporangium sp.]